MDEYGIGSAASMALHLYDRACRSSGRTSRLIARAGNDDLIVCRTGKEAERLRSLIKQRGKATRVTSVEHADDLHRVADRVRGRVHFDHDWVHQFFVDAVKGAEADLQRMADSLSSVPHDREPEKRHPMNMQRRGDFPV